MWASGQCLAAKLPRGPGKFQKLSCPGPTGARTQTVRPRWGPGLWGHGGVCAGEAAGGLGAEPRAWAGLAVDLWFLSSPWVRLRDPEQQGGGRTKTFPDCPLVSPSADSRVPWAFHFDLWDEIMGLLFLGATSELVLRSRVPVTGPGWQLCTWAHGRFPEFLVWEGMAAEWLGTGMSHAHTLPHVLGPFPPEETLTGALPPFHGSPACPPGPHCQTFPGGPGEARRAALSDLGRRQQAQ